MIISHKHKFIYIKTAKVGGTSFEIALSKYCGPDDIITSLIPKDEALKISLGFRGAQNTYKPYLVALYRKYRYKESAQYGDHIPSKEIKNTVSSKIWNNYLKIATIRCPYDTAVSFYFWKLRGKMEKSLYTKFDDYVKHNSFVVRVINFQGIHIDGKIATDFLIRYEHMDEDIKKLESKINCPGLLDTFKTINAKGSHRPKENSCREIYSKYPNAKSIIDKILYKQQDEYEFLRKYWPMYKAKLEEELQW